MLGHKPSCLHILILTRALTEEKTGNVTTENKTEI